MEYLKAKLIAALVRHFEEDYKRIDHALQVMHWAELIWQAEGGDYEIILACALLHDTGIKEAERMHSSSAGPLQEKYGPAIVGPILDKLGMEPDKRDIVCAIIGSHHTVNAYPSIEFKIMWDSDMMVNLEEIVENKSRESLQRVIEKNFTTPKGKELAANKYL